MSEDLASLIRELQETRQTVISLMPEHLRRLIDTEFGGPRTLDEWRAWKGNALDQLLILADPKPASTMGVWESITERAYCPLCHGSAKDIHGQTQGFALPDGLRRHLEGSSNSKQCPVLHAAVEFAWQRVREAESTERALREIAEKKRSKSAKSAPARDEP